MTEIENLWEQIDDLALPLASKELPLLKAAGCALASDVIAHCDLPGFDLSSMDGFAFAETSPGTCRVTGEIAAGDAGELSVGAGQAVRIFTGAKIPAGTLVVASQEDCIAMDQGVKLKPGIALESRENIRDRGGVVRQGETLLSAGTPIGAGSIALLASCGIRTVPVVPCPAVLHLATGSELVEAGTPLGPGKIYDSNGPMMESLLQEAGIRQVVRRRLEDSSGELLKSVQAFDGDLLLISGGSGPGDHDHTFSALTDAGYQIHASRINSRPGRPLIFASKGRQLAFGLPGNPLSHWVCFHAFVLRAIRRMQALPPCALLDLPLSHPIREKGDGRRTWTPGVMQWANGNPSILPLPWRHSGDLTPLTSANALILDGRQTMLLDCH